MGSDAAVHEVFLVHEVCRALINRAVRNEEDPMSDWRTAKLYRDQARAIRSLIADRDTLARRVEELERECERLRGERDDERMRAVVLAAVRYVGPDGEDASELETAVENYLALEDACLSGSHPRSE